MYDVSKNIRYEIRLADICVWYDTRPSNEKTGIIQRLATNNCRFSTCDLWRLERFLIFFIVRSEYKCEAVDI